MVTPPPGGTVRIELSRIESDVTDANGKRLKFEEKKGSPGDFEAKGKDGNLYSYSTKNVLVELAATAAVNNKEMRKRMPGIPLPKDEAKKLDEEIKEEKKAIKEKRKRDRQEAVKNGQMTQAEAEAQDKAEEDDDAAVESPEAESFKKRSVAPEEAAPPQAGRRGR